MAFLGYQEELLHIENVPVEWAAGRLETRFYC